MTESIKEFEPADDLDTEFAEAVDENAKAVFPEPQHGEQGEAVEYSRDVNPTTVEAVHEGANVTFPEPDVRQPEGPQDHHHDDFIPVTTDPEETQQKTELISMPVPVPVPSYDVPSYINLGSTQEVWGGEHDYGREGSHHSYEGGYASSVPIVPRSENIKGVESQAPSIRFVFLKKQSFSMVGS
jgi:hypothetical protein